MSGNVMWSKLSLVSVLLATLHLRANGLPVMLLGLVAAVAGYVTAAGVGVEDRMGLLGAAVRYRRDDAVRELS